MHRFGTDGQEIPGALYAKVLGTVLGSDTRFSVRFTFISPEIETFLQAQVATIEQVPASAAVIS
jgi:hypothetical protein